MKRWFGKFQKVIEQVAVLCTDLLENLQLKDKTELTKYLYMGKQRVWELNINGVNYKFHGAGCDAYYENKYIQWDFGRRSHWCCIDPWFIANTLKTNRSEYIQFYDGDFIKSKCEEAVIKGEMYCSNGRYYYTIPLEETFKPQFPEQFDSIIIEHFNDKWKLLRNKEVNCWMVG
ncbi:MAG: hypothetical protein HDT39_01085 [Lachnospiraceae bacterium]|nr:hypothetical protein [Lachnospiraceae bacterium]